jgi:hypothetical protein
VCEQAFHISDELAQTIHFVGHQINLPRPNAKPPARRKRAHTGPEIAQASPANPVVHHSGDCLQPYPLTFHRLKRLQDRRLLHFPHLLSHE